jgi:DNA adenine methylase
MKMKIKSIAPWFGGKRTLAPEIVKQLGPHTQYFEPFCGSLAVLLAKEKSSYETASDLHVDILNLARVLRDEELALKLYGMTSRTIFCESLLDEAKGVLQNEFSFETTDPVLMLERAYYYFVTSWMARNGVAGLSRQSFQMAVRWNEGGGSPTTRWTSATESIPPWHYRLNNVVFLCRDGFEVIPKMPDKKTAAAYIDPPYYKKTRSSGLYLHEFENGHHGELADILNRFKETRIVVSYYDHPEIRDLYKGWTFIEKTMRKNIANQNGSGSAKDAAREILIVNGPVF